MFAPSESTRFGSAIKIHKCIFAALISLLFHVKRAIASVAKICLHIFMTEREHVGLWLCRRPNIGRESQNILVCSISADYGRTTM